MISDISFLDFAKAGGLLPAVVQDATTLRVLMVGFVNEEALQHTLSSGKVTFFSRTKNRLWTKGETSGNYLQLVDAKADCDNDTVLFYAHPAGPTCHTGADTCFQEDNRSTYGFLSELESIIQQRRGSTEGSSYVRSLFEKGTHKIAQKVGEEAVELVIESLRDEPDKLINEAADLLFHYLILLQDRGLKLDDVAQLLSQRHTNMG